MRLCRFDDNRLGVVLGQEVADVTSVLERLPACRYPLPRDDLLVASLPALRSAIDAAIGSAARLPLATLTLLSPVANPGKLVGAPVNYRKHLDEVLGDASLHHNNRINEIQRAGLFLKATSSLVGCGEGVELNQTERRTDHEIELAVVIGRVAKNVSAADALDHVAGYSIGLDITIRGPEERSMRKSPDSYSVLGPWLVTADELPDPTALSFELTVNGEPRQRSNTSDLIIGVAELIEFASRFYTLHPGDIIYSGTPEGVAPIQPGDRMLARIEGIGEMVVDVRGPATGS
jgi:2-keto-4-pentenoate hydratase/2-oxohepta-3-ene-1,7-dioic acid hydratase in catechol pathway